MTDKSQLAIARFERACRTLNDLGLEGYHFFTNGNDLHMLTGRKEEGGEVLVSCPTRNIEGGDW